MKDTLGTVLRVHKYLLNGKKAEVFGIATGYGDIL
jgi:hypothetical protein